MRGRAAVAIDLTDEEREEMTARNMEPSVNELDEILASIPGGCPAS